MKGMIVNLRYCLLALLLTVPVSSYSENSEYGFLHGSWNCIIKSNINNILEVEVQSRSTVDMYKMTVFTKATITSYMKESPNKTSKLYVESNENILIEEYLVSPTNITYSALKVIKDDLNYLTPEFLAVFKSKDEVGEQVKLVEIDENTIKYIDVSTGVEDRCTKIK